MEDQSQINRIHEAMNDIFLALHAIDVCDPRSRDARQSAIMSLVAMRRNLENLGLHHAPLKKAPS